MRGSSPEGSAGPVRKWDPSRPRDDIVGSVHALQAVVLLAIATAASLPVTATFPIGLPGTGDCGSASLGSLRIDWLVGAFLLLAAVDHLTLSGDGRAAGTRRTSRAGSIRRAGGSTQSARRSWSCSSRCSPVSASSSP